VSEKDVFNAVVLTAFTLNKLITITVDMKQCALDQPKIVAVALSGAAADLMPTVVTMSGRVQEIDGRVQGVDGRVQGVEKQVVFNSANIIDTKQKVFDMAGKVDAGFNLTQAIILKIAHKLGAE
jgi:hypothetical protein